MNDYVLRSTTDAEAVLADLFADCVASGGEHLRLEVHEDKCFQPDTWVSVGTVSLHPELPGASKYEESGKTLLERALRYGFFDWELPKEDCLTSELKKAVVQERAAESAAKDLSNVAESVACTAIRCGLAHPAIDAMVLSAMPFRSTVGIVMDTTAVLHGGLDFAARHLTPAARLRVPAIVQMEILNFADRYFDLRNREKSGARMLWDHVRSQTGQRALIRLGLAHRVERPRLGAEPLRGIIRPGSDAEDRNLGLQVVQRSFADQLILETALMRQNDAAPDHPVMLMTADQGLARMALAEGIEPLFFDTSAAFDLLGATLSGVTFSPFATDGPRAYEVSLATILWELAVTFGSARLTCIASGDSFEATAIGETLSWQPYHTHEDLLWTRTRRKPAIADPTLLKDDVDQTETVMNLAGTSATVPASRRSRALSGAYVFSSDSMIDLIMALDHAPLSDKEGMEAAHVNKRVSYDGYWRFLCAGGFAVRSSAGLAKTERLASLIRSMANSDFEEMKTLLAGVPSFGRLLNGMTVGNPLTQAGSKIRVAAFRSYCALGEMCCAGVRFADTGIYATPENPTPEEFSRSALDAYDTVRQGEEYALTGAWLDEMIKRFGIHPVRARQRLAEAHQGGYIRRYVEGSTPETRYGNRNIHVLGLDGGVPKVSSVNLYHGDFLMPGRAAVSIRLSKGER